MDFATAITILGGEQLIVKILGPSFEYMGENLASWTKKMSSNLSKIFSSANKKLGNKINQPGEVSPKVLKGILENGAWCEEKLQAEYFGGVLASSRVAVSRDDRGAYYASIISNLSSYQLRLHYLFYSLIRSHFLGQKMNIGEPKDRLKMSIYIPLSSFFQTMDFSPEEYVKWETLEQHAIWGIYNAGLINNISYGSLEYIKTTYPDAHESGLVIGPTQLGGELFLWAYGHGQLPVNAIFDPSVSFNQITDIKIGPSFRIK